MMWFDNQRRGARPLGTALCVLALVGCASASQPEEDTAGTKRGAIGSSEYPVDSDIARQTGDPYTDLGEDKGSVFELTKSFDLPSWLGGSDDEETAAVAPSGTGIQVNGYLWGAALDTVSFMPLDTADPQGGIIKTGWYSEPDQPDQRHRVNVFIVSGQLRADGVRVSVFRQVRNEAGEWVDAEPLSDTASALKDVIMRRARELGVASTG